MKKILKKIMKNKYTPYIIIILFALIITIPLFKLTWCKYNEARIHIARVVSVKDIISKGIFPSLISARHMNSFGYALNIFYGPITTYIPILISTFTSCTCALKIFTFITIVLSGTMMYKFLMCISKSKTISLIGAIIYIAAPYKLTDIYSRNAVGEYTAFIFIPIVFNGLYNLIHNDKHKGSYLITIGAVGLILSHTITTIFTALFALIYMLYNANKLKDKIIWKKIGINLICILVLTSFYWIPLVEHKIYGEYLIYDEELMNTSPEAVYENTIGLKELFSSEFGTDTQEVVNSFGILIIFALIIGCFTFSNSKKHKEYIDFLILAILSLIMCTKLFPWLAMPGFLTVTQFAWRINGFFIFFISYVCAINIFEVSRMIRDKHRIIEITYLIVCVLCIIFGTMRFWSNYDYDYEKNFETDILNNDSIGPMNINREYLPVKCAIDLDYMNDRSKSSIVLNGSGTIENENKNELSDSFQIKDVNNATIELPYIYYHGYTVKLNGKTINNYESENGFVAIDLKEDGNITVDYTGTTIEKIGYMISATGLIIIIVVILIKRKKQK